VAAVRRLHVRHQWVSIAAQRLERDYFNRHGDKVGSPEPITEVLQRCPCQRLRTVTLDGVWTLGQINP
jgi:hypothetical protein